MMVSFDLIFWLFFENSRIFYKCEFLVASLSTCDNKESDLEVAEITASHAEDKLRIKVSFQLIFALF